MHAGKTGVGKSSTANSILAEPVAQVVAMQGPASRAQAFSRTAAGFTLTLIDTPGVLEGDAVDGAVRKLPKEALKALCFRVCDQWVQTLRSRFGWLFLGSQQSFHSPSTLPP